MSDYQSTMVDEPSAVDPRTGISELDGATIQRNADGSIVVEDQSLQGARIPTTGDHDENLAELMEEDERRQLAEKLIEYFEADKKSRAEWEDAERIGLELLGVKAPEEDSTVVSPGTAQVKHPMLIEAITRFQARAITELFPSGGPVKAMILGKQSAERTAQRDRVENFGNYYFTTMDAGYFEDTDQMLTYLPLSGSVFRKAQQNWTTGFVELRYVKATDLVVPYTAKSLRDASRYGHPYSMVGSDVRRAKAKKLWANFELSKPPTGGTVTNNPLADAADNREPSFHDDDNVYDFIEYHIDMDLAVDPQASKGDDGKDFEGPVPTYIVILERNTREVMMVRRNWKAEDPAMKRRAWFTHHKFLPGLGFYGWGYVHVLGSIQKAISDAGNAILDNAYAVNFQGGFITNEGKAAGLDGGEIRLEHGVYKQLKGSFEELSKAIWEPDFKPASPALALIAQSWLEAAQRFAATTDAAVGDADNTGPVGTTLALIEQSKEIPTAIHKRLHMSFGEELRMWAELVFEYGPDTYAYSSEEEEGQFIKADFDGRVDIVPVSDPNIWSNQQRLALAQAVLELQARDPSLYPPPKKIAAHRRLLEAMRVPNIDEIGPEMETPRYLDPIAENQAMMVGRAVKAFEQQHHPAHIAIHKHQVGYLTASGMPPEQLDPIMAVHWAHIREHMALDIRAQVIQMAGVPLPPLDESGEAPELPPDLEAEVSQAVMEALPALPPPPQATGEDGAVDADATIAKTKAAIEAKDMESKAAIARADEAFEAEEARKEVAFQAEQHRVQEAAIAEQHLQNEIMQRDQKRQDIGHRTQLRREQQAGQLKLGQQQQAGDIKLDQQQQTGKLKSGQMREQGTIKSTQMKQAGDTKLKLAKEGAKQKAKTAARKKTTK